MNAMLHTNLPTPYYQISEEALDQEIALLKNAMSTHWGRFIPSYSVKTNSLPWLLHHMKEKGLYAEIVSEEEYGLVKRIGFPEAHMIYNGPIKSRPVFETILLSGGLVNLDSSKEPEWLADLCARHPDKILEVGLRVNFDLSLICPEEVLTEEEGSRFGYAYESGELKKVIHLLKQIPNARITGLHLHSSTRSRSVNVYRALASCACKVAAEFDLPLQYMDMGGGYYGGIPDKPNYNDYMKAIGEALAPFYSREELILIAEPGVSLISSSFSFVTQVLDVKRIREHTYLVTNGSRLNLNPQITRHWYPHHLVRPPAPMLQGSGSAPLSQTDFDAIGGGHFPPQTVCGASCMEYDRLFTIQGEPPLQAGDYIVYDLAGGYTLCLTPLFIHYFPAVYVDKKDGALLQVRAPWTNEEFLQKNVW